jgi:hypothetical protein
MKHRDCQTSAAEGVKKPAPSIPRTVLLEPYLSDEEPFDITAKGGKLLLTAIRIHPQRAAQIQTEHFHEALSVDLVVGVPDNNREPPRRGQRHKFLNILNRLEPNLKFPHKSTSCNCTNLFFSCIIGGNDPAVALTSPYHRWIAIIIAVSPEISTVGLDD